ncbi:Arc family DNA-binding protein [Rhizobium halophytocola]|uniref:Arc-like DNA binding domain-containing protein n=1 Tax=Rhizobium halophytocola TaxID=735519 RepID=A0ABS4E0P4_9HYPH|nr:Arc family DNA-binding protein [Rhizobium halophytocola]MBP1851519.1 hypothetical protein [Rhizobium halophytocola]
MQQTRTTGQFPLRMPDKLRTAIKYSAMENGRSMNSEIVFRLFQIFHQSRDEMTKADAKA